LSCRGRRQRARRPTGREEFSITGLEGGEADEVTVRGDDKEFRARLRLDTPREREYSSTAAFSNTCCAGFSPRTSSPACPLTRATSAPATRDD